MEADDLTDVYMRINASGRDDGLARALTTAEEFRAIYRRLDAEREAREALAARVAALEAAQAPPPSPAPTDAAVCKLCNDTGWYELDETRCPRGCSINDERIAFVRGAPAPPPAPAPTEGSTHWEGCGIDGGRRHHECLVGEYERLRARAEAAESLRDRHARDADEAERECNALRAERDLRIEERDAARTGWEHEANLRIAAERECDALRADRPNLRIQLDAALRDLKLANAGRIEAQTRLDELEPLVALRPSVLAFASEMERKLSARDRVRGERGWIGCTPEWLYSRLAQEANELLDAIRSCNTMILEEAADVANFAMMIADVCGLLSTERARRRAEEQ